MWNSRSHWSQMIMVRAPKPPRSKSGLPHSVHPPATTSSAVSSSVHLRRGYSSARHGGHGFRRYHKLV